MPNNDLISRVELARDLSYSAPELFFDKDYLMTKIARQPAVDAIPVEWLREWQDEVGTLNEWWPIMERIITVWREEQEAKGVK